MLEQIADAVDKAEIYDLAVKTPVSKMKSLSEKLNCSVWLKREDQQPVFSFKIRGATNKIAHLDKSTLDAGVVAASAGNHAQGVAIAAQKHGIKARIVMPRTTPPIKYEAVESYGAEVILHGDSYDEASSFAKNLCEESGATYLHPFDDLDVIAGQGTIGKELLEQMKSKPDVIFMPVGGGGLIAGVGAYIKARSPNTKIIGVEPEGAAGLNVSLQAGKRVLLNSVDPFVDGVAVKMIGENNFNIAQKCVDEVVVVSNDEICAAVRDTFQATRSVVEPSGALALAGLKRYAKTNDISGKTVVSINSGANVNFDRFGDIVERAELGAGEEALLAVEIPERPGSFLEFCELLGERNITEFNYRYGSDDRAVVLAGIRIKGGRAERQEIVDKVGAHGFKVNDLTENEMAKAHIRYMVGGRVNLPDRELIYRFEFPERYGALLDFLKILAGRWSISLFHYRNHGSATSEVLVGMIVPEKDDKAFDEFLQNVGYKYYSESQNRAYEFFLKG